MRENHENYENAKCLVLENYYLTREKLNAKNFQFYSTLFREILDR